MKLDKTSIFGMTLAFVLIMFQMQYSSKNREAIAAKNLAKNASPESIVEQAREKEEAVAKVSLPEDFKAEEVTLSNEHAIFRFSTATGAIDRVEFRNQHEVNQLDVPVSLNRFGMKSICSLEKRSGVTLEAGYRITKQSDDSITFLGKLANGTVIQKAWSFVQADVEGADYRLKLKLTIENPKEDSIEASNYNLYIGGAAPLYKGELPDQSGYYFLSNKGYKKIKSNPLKKSLFGSKLKLINDDIDGMAFAGVGNQFFTCFITPQEKYDARYIARAREVKIAEQAGGGLKNEISLAVSLPDEIIEGGSGREQFNFELYAGPKHYQTLKKIEPNGGLVMNYGFFKPISGILNNILTFLHNVIFSKFAGGYAWGLSIIALTLVIRTFMWPLHNVSTRNMKRMSKLQPKIKELKEKYPDDPQKVQMEQMKLFGEYGINPMGGCLPMLGQIPIFFGLFTMLKSAVEFRHEGFLWIDDLSQPDHLFDIPLFGADISVNLLPIFMLITMMIQMSMNPTQSADASQKMMMRIMPFMMFVFCYNFASALALYWTTSNIFTIFQTWIVKKMPEPELKKKKVVNNPASGGGFLERLQKQAEEMQKKQDALRSQQSNSHQMRDAKPKKKRGPRTGG